MKKGDAITLVQEMQLVLIECLFVHDEFALVGAYKLSLADEGITWLKGYHTPDEECVSAARTCQALREQETGVTGSTGPTGPMPNVQPMIPNVPGPYLPIRWGSADQPLLCDHTIIVSKTTAGIF
jgi:hypothetical protein